ncbi:TPA: hypothetical protein I2T40_13180 [Staphylococcus aureus]|nr:hypothetical protein [Staphylococcus aureus]
MHEFYSCIPIFKYILAVANVQEPLHNKSLVALYHFCHTPSFHKKPLIQTKKTADKALCFIDSIKSTYCQCITSLNIKLIKLLLNLLM